MGNWWLAPSSWQSCTMPSAEFVGKTSHHPGDSAPLQPRFGALQLLAFPKTKIIFERGRISDHQWDSGKYDGPADVDWEKCVKYQGAYFEGAEASLSYVQCFLYLIFLYANVYCSFVLFSIFYYCSGTVVSIFPPQLPPTAAIPTSHPSSYPTLALSMCPLYMFLMSLFFVLHGWLLPGQVS